MSDQDLIQNAALVTKYDEVMDTTPVVMQSKQFELNAMQFQNLNILMDILRISPFKSGQVSCLEMAATPSCKLQVVYLPDLSNAEPEVLLNQIDELLFERLMLDNETVKKNVIEVEVTIVKRKSECNASETQQLFYLYQCYHRLHEAEPSVDTELGLAIKKSIVNQTASYLCQPVIYPCQDTTPGLLLKLMDKYYADYGHYDVLQAFLEATATEIQQRNKDGDDAADLIAILIDGYYKKLVSRLSGCSLVGHQLFASLSLVKLIASTPTLSQSFIILNSPWKARSNYDFKVGLGGKSASEDVMNSLLGRLLSTSCLLSQGETVPEFFVTPSRSSHHEHQVTERNIGVQLKRLTEEIHQLFLGLLRNKVTKNEILNWIGLVLYAFKDRSKMWTNEMIMSTGTSIQTSDGFMLNFSNVLLLLCRPFSEAYSPKLLKIDPRYCSSPALPLDKTLGDMNGINIRSLSEETFIIQNPVEAEDSTAREQSVNQYNFMTEIFYAAHKALQIGFRSCHERFLRLASDMNHIQRVYEEARMQSMQGNEMLERLQEQMDKGMAQFLSMKAMLSQSDTVELMLQFHIATATWLNNLSISESADDASHGFKKITKSVLGLDGTANVKNCLDAIPEFIVDNISDMVTFVRRFSDKTLTLPNLSLEPLMTLIIIFMGCSDKMKNPHSRARLAEVLECLMPRTESEYPGQMNYSSSYDVTKKLFTEHPLADELTPTLLNVFVSIEMTGQSVAFEQKFQYRRPMYLVLKYLCTEVTDPHRRRMKELAIYAEEHIEAGDAPLFLRFVNLLINDAIFLLDEGLNYMSKLKELQRERDSGNWGPQQQSNYHHMGRLARFHNVIGKDTIDTLAWITADIKTIFCNHNMVDRVAGMLNYFLKYLVGPKKTDYKVKQMEDFEFKPADIVHDICLIYTHLSVKLNPKDKEFCIAVANDGRSYSEELLPAASHVLIKTGKSTDGLAEKVVKLSAKVQRLSKENEDLEVNVDDVPDDYLDPIMSTLMTDPVKLPSGYIVDRSTIARHLLSDQTDPFTRAPLTMENVVPDTELKQKIDDFVSAYQANRSK